MESAVAYADIDPNSIVGIWLFDEGTGEMAKDSWVNGYHGKLNGPVWVDGLFGKVSGAMNCDPSVSNAHK
jgi:hypothetical protein